MSDCIGCIQSLTQQKTNDEKIIHIAREKADRYSTVISLYRDAEGNLCVVPDDGQQYPVIMQITPKA